MQRVRSTAKRFRRDLIEFLFTVDTRYCEVSSGLLALGWGLLILFALPHDKGSTDLYNWMFRFLPGWIWGTAMVTLGTAQIIGGIMKLPGVRAAAALVVAPIWTFLAVAIALSGNRPVVGSAAYVLWALLVSWAYVRLAWGGFMALPTKRIWRAVRAAIREF